jgi:hypothetical protein
MAPPGAKSIIARAIAEMENVKKEAAGDQKIDENKKRLDNMDK